MVLLVHERRAEKEGDVRIISPRSVGALIQGRNKKMQECMEKGQAASLPLRQFTEGPRGEAMEAALSFVQWVSFRGCKLGL